MLKLAAFSSDPFILRISVNMNIIFTARNWVLSIGEIRPKVAGQTLETLRHSMAVYELVCRCISWIRLGIRL